MSLLEDSKVAFLSNTGKAQQVNIDLFPPKCEQIRGHPKAHAQQHVSLPVRPKDA